MVIKEEGSSKKCHFCVDVIFECPHGVICNIITYEDNTTIINITITTTSTHSSTATTKHGVTRKRKRKNEKQNKS